METLKPLDQLTAMDVRQELHGYTLAERYQQVAELELSSNVPEDIASAFAVARNLWLYGWFHWPLYPLASFEAWRCIEMTLKSSWKKVGSPPLSKNPNRRDEPSFRQLFRFAWENNWFTNKDFTHFRRSLQARKYLKDLGYEFYDAQDSYVTILKDVLPKLRNDHVHPSHLTIFGPDQALGDLETARDVIQKLCASTFRPGSC